MEQHRRDLLKAGSGLSFLGLLAAIGIVPPKEAIAEWNKGAFESNNLPDALRVLGAASPAESREVRLDVPEIAENGAVVPASVSTALPKVEQIAILVEKNANPLSCNFKLPEGTEPGIQVRIRLAQTSNVVALVKADGKFYMATREVKVTIGDCCK